MLAIPVVKRELFDIDVKSFGDQRTGGNGTVRSVRESVFAVTFKKNTRVDGIELLKLGQVDVGDDSI